MPQDPKNQLPEDVKEGEPRPERAPYHPPHLRRLGSVRDLTLGSPVGGFMDGLPGGMRSM